VTDVDGCKDIEVAGKVVPPQQQQQQKGWKGMLRKLRKQ
jgi:hypothetical protein